MSESRADYKAGEITTLEQFKKLACCIHWEEPGYKDPEPEDIKTLARIAGWTNNQTAKLLGLHYTPNKGSPTLGRYRAKKGSRNYLQIPKPNWRLLLIYAGVVNPADDVETIKQSQIKHNKS